MGWGVNWTALSPFTICSSGISRPSWTGFPILEHIRWGNFYRQARITSCLFVRGGNVVCGWALSKAIPRFDMFLDLWRGKHWSVKSIDINWNWLDTHCSAPPSPFSKIGKLTNSAWTFSLFYLMTLGVLGLAKTCTLPPNNLDCDTSTRFPNQCQGLPAIKFSSPPTSHIDKCDQKFTTALLVAIVFVLCIRCINI